MTSSSIPTPKGLLAAIPVLGVVQKHLAVIPGSVPNLINLPPGCKFAPAVPTYATCARQREPRLVEAAPGHLTRCFMRDPETAQHWEGVEKATWQFGGDEVLVPGEAGVIAVPGDVRLGVSNLDVEFIDQGLSLEE